MHFYVPDEYPDAALADIWPVETRIKSLLSRCYGQSEDIDENVKIIGSLRIVDGLAYHFNNYCSALPAHKTHLSKNVLHHELVAYLNRLGQYSYFAKTYSGYAEMHRIHELLAFRHKHSAHRSIDAPKGETTLDRRLQAFSMASNTSINGRHVAILNLDDNQIILDLELDHPLIMTEIFDLYKSICAVRRQLTDDQDQQ